MKNKAEQKNKGIQILRALCAIQVFLSHTLNVYQDSIGVQLIDTPLHFFYDGQCAVIIFFALSGFLYYNEKQLTYKSYTNKILSKSLHIFPPYWTSLIIGTIMCNLYLKYNITKDISNTTLTEWIASFWNQPISIIDFIKAIIVFPLDNTDLINPPAWYLLIEIKMFFLMPLLVHIFNKYSWAYAYIILFAALFIPSPKILTISSSFILGACTHKYIKKFHFSSIKLKYILLYIFIGCVILNIKNEIDVTKFIIPPTIIQTIGAVFIIFSFYYFQINYTKWYTKLLISIGNISYEIYILHFIFLLIFIPFLTNNNNTLLIIITFTLTLLMAYPVHKINNKISQKILSILNSQPYKNNINRTI